MISGFKIGLETMKSILGLPTEDVLTAVAEMVPDDNIVLGESNLNLKNIVIFSQYFVNFDINLRNTPI